MPKAISIVHLVHKGKVVKPGNEVDLTSAQFKKLQEKGYVEKPGAETKDPSNPNTTGSGVGETNDGEKSDK